MIYVRRKARRDKPTVRCKNMKNNSYFSRQYDMSFVTERKNGKKINKALWRITLHFAKSTVLSKCSKSEYITLYFITEWILMWVVKEKLFASELHFLEIHPMLQYFKRILRKGSKEFKFVRGKKKANFSDQKHFT